MPEGKPEIVTLIADPGGRHRPLVVELWQLAPDHWTLRWGASRGRMRKMAAEKTREAALCAAMGFRG